MNGWVKLTPETMPPHKQRVIICIEDDRGRRFLNTRVYWDAEYEHWMIRFHDEEEGPVNYFNLHRWEKVTHWMPYPELPEKENVEV